jgi:membrane fusion protein (multidrug efflux system)
MLKLNFSRTICLASLYSLVCLIGGGCNEGNSRQANSRNSAGRGSKVPVNAVVVTPRALENKIFATGTLMANEEVELRPEISGRVINVYFQEGGRVRKGDLLLKINDSELKAQLKRKDLEEKLASDEERRKRSLLDINGISQEEYDKSVNALRMIQAEKEIIQSQLAKTEIVAPFDGTVGLRHVSEGSYVTNNMLAATMQDNDPMKVEFAVPEKYALQIERGTDIVARIGESQEEYRGQVYAVESKIDLGTRTIRARAIIPNPNENLVPGSFARVEIMLERLPDAIVIPAEAVVPELSGEKVFVYRDGKAHAVPVRTGMRTEKSIHIIEGLNPQDTIVVTGLLQLSDGRAVEIRELSSE